MKKTIQRLEKERMQWSRRTFPEATALSSLEKLKSETEEIEKDIKAGKKVPEEYADALMCLFDSAARQGITIDAIFKAFEEKLEINKRRIWVKNPDNSYSHVNFQKVAALLAEIKPMMAGVSRFSNDPVKAEQYDRAYKAYGSTREFFGEGGTGTLQLIWWYQNIYKPGSKENRKKVIIEGINAHLQTRN